MHPPLPQSYIHIYIYVQFAISFQHMGLTLPFACVCFLRRAGVWAGAMLLELMCPNYLIYSFAHDMAVGVCARAVLANVHDLISLHYLCGQLAFIMVQLRRPEIPEVFAIHFGEAWKIYCACHAYPHIKLKIFAQPEMVSIPPFHTHVHIGSLDGAWAHVASMGSSDAYLLVPNDGRPVIPL